MRSVILAYKDTSSAAGELVQLSTLCHCVDTLARYGTLLQRRYLSIERRLYQTPPPCSMTDGTPIPHIINVTFMYMPAMFPLPKVIDNGKVVYKWVGKNPETGRPDPSVLPDLTPVKRVLARERSRL